MNVIKVVRAWVSIQIIRLSTRAMRLGVPAGWLRYSTQLARRVAGEEFSADVERRARWLLRNTDFDPNLIWDPKAFLKDSEDDE